MRLFQKGKPFMDVEAEAWIPNDDMLQEMDEDLGLAQKDGFKIPVFSEMHLYPRLGKDDARFVLAIAEEYTHIINKLGVEKVRELLGDNG